MGWIEPAKHIESPSLTEISRHTGWPLRTLQTWRSAEDICKDPATGMFSTREIWKIAQIRNVIDDDTPTRATIDKAELDAVRARKIRADAQIAELKLQRERKELFTKESVANAYRKLCEGLRSRLRQMPGRLSLELEGAPKERVKEVLTREVQKLSNEIEGLAGEITIDHPEAGEQLDDDESEDQ